MLQAFTQGDRMNQSLLWGIGMVTLAGILQGSFAVPMKRMSAWRWENSWLVFALFGLIVFPWIINFATVPNVTSVYAAASTSTLVKVLVFGLLWGVGATLFGLGISRVGMALGFALDPRHYRFVWLVASARASSSRPTGSETWAGFNRRHCRYGRGARFSRARRTHSRT